MYHDGKCIKTHGNETLTGEDRYEWCSNIATDRNDTSKNPWIQYSIPGKFLRVSSFALKNGCCRYASCCDETNSYMDYECCCLLYSYSLQASNDNKTWTVLHKVEKDKSYEYCSVRSFDLEQVSAPFRFFRFVLDEEYPGCPKCMQINQIELYGDKVMTGFVDYSEGSDEDESISIIGRIKRGE